MHHSYVIRIQIPYICMCIHNIYTYIYIHQLGILDHIFYRVSLYIRLAEAQPPSDDIVCASGFVG